MTVGRFGPVSVIYPSGAPGSGVAFEVRDGAGMLAALFTTTDGLVEAPNPAVATELGEIGFFAEPGLYVVEILETGFQFSVVSYLDFINIKGDTGPQGAQGIQGAGGAASVVPGPQGVQGNVGAQGGIGPQGIQGNVGAQGGIGPQGIQGNLGPQGGVGPQGVVSLTSSNTWTGTQTFNTEPRFKSDLATNLVGSAGANSLMSSPFAGSRTWFDRMRFLAPTLLEVSALADNTGWTTAGAITQSNFADLLTGRTDATKTLCTAALPSFRVTWNNSSLSYSQIQYMLIAFTWSASAPTANRILVETSVDGITWVVRRDITAGFVSGTMWAMKVDDNSSHPYYRLSIMCTAGPTNFTLAAASIQAFSGRAGDQGSGFQVELPFLWNGKRTVTFQPAPGFPDAVPLISKGVSGQAADLQQWQDSGSGMVAFLTAAGNLYLEKWGTGVYMRSPNGTRYKLSVSDAGVLGVVAG